MAPHYRKSILLDSNRVQPSTPTGWQITDDTQQRSVQGKDEHWTPIPNTNATRTDPTVPDATGI